MTIAAKLRLLDKINNMNNTALTLQVVDFGEPSPSASPVPGSKSNTKITIQAKPGQTNLFGSREIIYQRLDFSDFFEKFPLDRAFFIENVIQYTWDMIPFLNQKFGLTIEKEDIVNVPVPTFNPTTKVEFLFGSTLNSIEYCGTYKFSFDPSEDIVPGEPGIRDILFYEEGQSDLRNCVKKVTTAGILDTRFKFLGNVSEISMAVVSRILPLKNGTFVALGTFTFKTTTEATDTYAYAVVFDSIGAMISFGSDDTLAAVSQLPDANVSYDANSESLYFISQALGLNQASLYKLNLADLTLADFTPAITYKPALIKALKNGQMLAVSPVYNAGNPFNGGIAANMVRIDKLNLDGTVDQSFQSPTFYMNIDSRYIPEVVSIEEAKGGKFFIFLNPGYGLNTKHAVPMISGEPLVDSVLNGVPTAFAWSPVALFSPAGALLRIFKNVWPDRSGDQSAFFEGAYERGRRYLLSVEDQAWLFMYKTNPISGYNHVQPITFDRFGTEKLQSGVEYLKQFKWSRFLGSEILEDGSVIAYGDIQVFNQDRIYGEPFSAIVSYLPNGNVNKIVYRNNTISLSSNPRIKTALI